MHTSHNRLSHIMKQFKLHIVGIMESFLDVKNMQFWT